MRGLLYVKYVPCMSAYGVYNKNKELVDYCKKISDIAKQYIEYELIVVDKEFF